MSVTKLNFLLIFGAVIGFGQVDQTEFFETRVRPVLANNCYACHTSSKLGGLQVDSRAALLQGGKSGPAIALGKAAAESLLIPSALPYLFAYMPCHGYAIFNSYAFNWDEGYYVGGA